MATQTEANNQSDTDQVPHWKTWDGVEGGQRD